MNRKQKTILLVLVILACVLIAGAGTYAYGSYRAFAQQPLGPVLPEFTRIPLPATWTPTAGTPSAGAVTLAPTFAIPPTNTSEPFCNVPPVTYLLAIGADSRKDSYEYGLADAIRIVRIEAQTLKVAVLEVPRDLWVYIPHIKDNLKGIDHAKLNQAYLFGQPGSGFHYWDDPSGGPGLLALTLNENFGIRSDHYVSINMRTFENVVNAVDGIDLYVPDEEASRNTGLPIGENHLDGPTALKVARNREEGIFERANNQNRVLCALRRKLTSPSVVPQIPDLLDSFRDNVLTDLTPDQIAQFACLGLKLKPQNVVFASFPEDLFKPSRHKPDLLTNNPNGVFVWDANYDVLRNYVAQFQAGTWPPPPTVGKATEEVVCE